MRRRIVVLAVVMVGGCGQLSGLDDISIGDALPIESTDSGAQDPPDGRAPEPVVDAAVDAAPSPFSPTLASCGAAHICLPNTDGWSPAIVPEAPATCPTDWPSSTEFQTSSGGSCECKCTANGTCDGAFTAFTGATCKQSQGTWGLSPGDGTCFAGSVWNGIPSPFMLKPDMSAANRPTACTGTIVPSLAPATKVVTCSGAASTTATACGNGEVCLPTFDTSKGAANCIKHEGDVACPKELRTRFVVGASMQDGRSCTGKCTCATNDCLGGKVELYDATNCPAANLRRTIVIDGTCDTTTPATGGFGGSGRYFAPSGCEVKEAPTVTGTQTPVSPTTFCCMDGAPSPVH